MKSSASRRDVMKMRKLSKIKGMTNARIGKKLRIHEETVAKFIGSDVPTLDDPVLESDPAEAPDEVDTRSPQQKAADTRKANAEKAAKENAE